MKRQVELSLALIPLILSMAYLYFNGNPQLGQFRLHWLPEMMMFAIVGSILASKPVRPSYVIALYVVLLGFGYLISYDLHGYLAVPFSSLIAFPLLASYAYKMNPQYKLTLYTTILMFLVLVMVTMLLPEPTAVQQNANTTSRMSPSTSSSVPKCFL